ncbi:MAG TPA: aldehyde ferredoxin oxidoreductase family protein [Thermodesulfobacteriota bacterium]|nr:aldehyde ferredoxin oxidoreductase family protein [Thermodesulfobacteriota bacterium]
MENSLTGPIQGQGFWGKVLHCDLNNRQIETQLLDEALYQKYLSGLGLGVKILWDRIKPGIDPLGPDNILGFTTGLLTDTGTLFTGRFTVVGKSPQTKGWGEANAGGYFSPLLKRCGIDAVFFHGRSPKPVYLYLDDHGVEIRDASDLWGLDTVDTEKKLKEIHGSRAQTACIGPAGEKLSFLAGIVTDKGRIAARGGLGAVMGSKNLKAVVAAGTRRVGVKDRKKVIALTQDFQKRLRGKEGLKSYLGDRLLGLMGWITRKSLVYPRQPADLWRLLLSKFGTPALTALSAESGDSPIKNWGGIGYRDFPLSRSQKIGAEAVLKYETKKYGCFSCPLHCGGIMKIPDEPFPIEEMHKPEYETLCAFGGLLLNDDLGVICKMNDLVNRAGMDSISCGSVIAFAIECFESGLLNKADTDGLELRWGGAESILTLTEKIIKREGFGDILADGVKKAAERIGRGSEQFAVHCGGIEPAMHDPKFDPGFGMIYACEPTPGRHTVAAYQYLDLQLLEKKFKKAKKIPFLTTHKEKYRYDNKGPAIAVDCFYKMLLDGAGGCLFGTQIGGNLPLCEWLNAVTGWELAPDDYLVIGERIEQLRQAFNVREGLNAKRDFQVHPRIYGDPPQAKGPAKGISLDMDQLGTSFYQAMHWDLESGIPNRDRLAALEMDDVLQTFYPQRGE